mmetsp:Transcript_123244/g.307762  ORF Transcript_123244/g.307762 Transcript_123244/m.307762 type:complete len:297 (-) Transcript_123244:119-1009(-)
MHSDSMELTASSDMGTPWRCGRTSPNWWSLQARSTNWEMMWRGAMEAVAPSPLCTDQSDFKSRKRLTASLKLPVFSAALMATIVALVVHGMFSLSISAKSFCTSAKARVVKCMVNRTSYVRWSGWTLMDGIMPTILSTSSVSKRLVSDSSRSFTTVMLHSDGCLLKKALSSRMTSAGSFLKRCMDSTACAMGTAGTTSKRFSKFQHCKAWRWSPESKAAWKDSASCLASPELSFGEGFAWAAWSSSRSSSTSIRFAFWLRGRLFFGVRFPKRSKFAATAAKNTKSSARVARTNFQI